MTEDNDNAEHVTLRRVWLDWLRVAAVLLLAFVIRSVSTSDSNAAVVDVEPLQAVEILDTLDVAPSAPADSIQATEGSDNADTLDIAPAAPADSIQATEGSNNADTLDIAPAAPVDSIQTTEGSDNAEHVAPVAHDNIEPAQGATPAAPLVLIL